MIIQPKARGFICTTAHPVGCAQNVSNQIDYVKQRGQFTGPKKVLVIGASTGYGLASRISAAFGSDAKTIGVFFEKAPTAKRTATAGWYNTAAFEQQAHDAGLYARSINGDAFSDEVKQQVIERIKQDWQGGVDLVIYSLASPRRKDPKTGEIYSSTLRTLGEPFSDKSINLSTKEVEQVTIEPANDAEKQQTIKVMGGEDWQLWMQALQQAGVLADGVQTVAYSYIGPTLTHAIYREGTIGSAKKHLEATAKAIDEQLATINGHAYISVNKALVTQAAAAIPVVPLYSSILYRVMKANHTHEGCIEQMDRMMRTKIYADGVQTDAQQLIRMDDWEMDSQVQAAVADAWQQVTTENLSEYADFSGYQQEFMQLFGFEVDGIDYDEDVDIDVAIRSISEEK